MASITTWAKEKNMAKAIRKNLEDIALPAVPKATPGLNIPIDFFMARGRGRGRGEEVATGARAAEESERSGRVKPGGTIRRGAAGSSGARPAGAGNRWRSGPWRPSPGARAAAAPGCARGPRGRRSPRAGRRGRAGPARNEGAAGPARACRRLFRGEALPLQRPSATAVIRAFQPQMWA